LKICCVLQDDERDKIVFHKTIPNLQDQAQDQDRFFWSQTGLVLRPTVSDHITAKHSTRYVLVARRIWSLLVKPCTHK